MIIVHAADIHLGSPLGGLDRHEGLDVERIRQAPLAAFGRIADLCEQRGAGLLLIAGDLFDGDAPIAVIREADAVLRRIAGGGTRVVMIRGNHDAESKMQRRLADIEGVTELSTSEAETLLVDDTSGGSERIAVHGRGFADRHVPDNIVPSYPARVDGACNIGLLHTSLEGNAAHAVYAPCSVADLAAKGYDYWALGHIHKREIVSADPWVVYAGSPQGRHINEGGAHGVYVLEVEGGRIVGEPEHVELGAVQWHRLTVEADTEEQVAAELVAAAGRALAGLVEDAAGDVMHVVRVELTGRCSAHTELAAEPGRWRDELAREAMAMGGECMLEQVRISTAPPLPPSEVLRERRDFVGELARSLAAKQLEFGSGGDDSPPPDPPPAFTRLDEKLRPLAGAADALREQPITEDEFSRASNELLGRLVAATTLAAEGDR